MVRKDKVLNNKRGLRFLKRIESHVKQALRKAKISCPVYMLPFPSFGLSAITVNDGQVFKLNDVGMEWS